MRIKKLKVLIGIVASIVLMGSIPALPPMTFDYVNLNLQAHFTDTTNPLGDVTPYNNTPSTNILSNDGATLGRVLFYDKNLSLNNTVSCGSCHKQANAFSDTAIHSLGFNGGTTRRHSMPLMNIMWHKNGKMFWDERAATLEDQVLMPIQDPVEMGLSLTQLVQRVQQQSYYPQLFLNAFGDTTVTTTRISKALAQFVRSIVSHSSKYDIGRAQVSTLNQIFPNFTLSENLGKSIFFRSVAMGGGGCFGCHTSEAFINAQFGPRNNGLDSISTIDLGAFEPNQIDSTLIGRFKVSTLRNIALTAPYMHDGRFATLEQVIDHYSTGIKLHRNLSPRFIDTVGNTIVAHKFNFTSVQKTALVDFLKTFTDSTILTEVKWSDPFACSAEITASGNTTICNGSSVTLNVNTGMGRTYKWKKDGIDIQGATADSYVANTAGNYTCEVTNICNSTSNIINVVVNNLPSAAVTNVGDLTFCSGGSVILNAPVGSNLTYQWKKNGSTIQGATSNSYSATASGNYKVLVTNTSTGCSKSTANKIVVTVKPLPKAIITAQSATTFCTGGSVVLAADTQSTYSYKWKKGSNYIPGETLFTYTATATGNYKVEVTDNNGCAKTSGIIAVTVPCRVEVTPSSDLYSLNQFVLNAYLNESSNQIIVDLSQRPSELMQIELIDCTGRTLFSAETNNNLFTINTSNLNSGFYYLLAKNEVARAIKKISIVK